MPAWAPATAHAANARGRWKEVIQLVTREEIRDLFLFAQLSDEQLDWLVGQAQAVDAEEGEVVLEGGSASAHFVVLLEGELVVNAVVAGEQRPAVSATQPGVYAGGLPMFDRSVPISAHAGQKSRLIRLNQDQLMHMVREGFPGVGYHLLQGMEGARTALTAVSQQEKLSSLGKLSAGLAHELNNPSSAAARSARLLPEAIHRVRGSALAATHVDPHVMDAIRKRMGGPAPDPVSRADREDELALRLAAMGAEDPHELASSLAGAGLTARHLDELEEVGNLTGALELAGAESTAEALASEIGDAATRITDLVHAMKEFTFRDQAPLQHIDIHTGLENTLTLLAHRIPEGVTVQRELAPDLPTIEARGGELNQVWMNLLDNALDALGESGTIRIRTQALAQRVIVEISDTGPGVPPELVDQIFDPFVTTKDVGAGTGLGLDIARRITRFHHGSIELDPRSPETTFRVTLPKLQPPRRLEPEA